MEQAVDFNIWGLVLALIAFGALGYFIWSRKNK